MKLNFKKLSSAIFGMMVCSGVAIQSNAQVTYPYEGDFEVATTNPSSKSYASTDSIVMNNMPWTMPGVFLGSMTASDRYNGAKGARVRLTNNTNGNPAYLEMLANLPSGAGTVTYKAAKYGNDGADSMEVLYSVNNGTSWTSAGYDVVSDTALQTFNHVVNVSGNVRIKFQKLGIANSRICMDDINITAFSGSGPSLYATGFSPVGSNVSLATDSLIITFNDSIAVVPNNVDMLWLYKAGTGMTNPVATFSGVTAIVDGKKAIFTPIALDNNTDYFVIVDSFHIQHLNNTSVSYNGNFDSTTWTFSTIDTTPIPPMTSLSETFTICSNNGAMGKFVQYSKEGAKTWKCSSFGHTDSNSVYFNGGSSAGAEASNDWLITSAPLDFSAMDNPVLSFYQKRRFSGNVTRSIKVSTNYIPGTDPANAVWATLSVPELGTLSDTVWNKVNGILLNSYKNTPFYMAFVYQCDTVAAWEWTLDDINVTDSITTGIKNITGNIANMQVLGQAQSNQINLNIEAVNNGQYELQIFDLLGRNINNQSVNLQSGNNRISLSNLNLSSGMHIIRLKGNDGIATVKAVVK